MLSKEKELGFSELGLNAALLSMVKKTGFATPTSIQQLSIPAILEGKDVLAQAKTGSGKTLAYGLPIIHALAASKGNALVITPTRELCQQINGELSKFGQELNIVTVPLYGGAAYSKQIDSVRRGVQIIVATPGRLLDFITKGYLKNFRPSTVVLDEADEMMDMGFIDDIEKILELLPSRKQTLLFSATLPQPIVNIAKRFMREPVALKAEGRDAQATPDSINQIYYYIRDDERLDALIRIIDFEQPAKALIFCRTKVESDELCTALLAKGLKVKVLHGSLEQNQREEVVKALRAGTIKIVVATDVAARGLDIQGISHVFNYHIPTHVESYIHRIGRTGRGSAFGTAFTLVSTKEKHALKRIEQVVKGTLRFGEIPTLEDLKTKQQKLLLEKLQAYECNEEAKQLYTFFSQHITAKELAEKLLAMHFNTLATKGRGKIGLKEHEVQNVKEVWRGQRGPSRGSQGGGQRGYGRQGGGQRSYGGQGGGQRSNQGGSRNQSGQRSSSENRNQSGSRDQGGSRTRSPQKSPNR